MSEIPEGFREADFGGNFLRQNGPFYLKRSEGGWLVGQRVGEQHVNYIGIAHGGMLSTLADVAMSAQPYYSERPNPAVTTTTMTTNFLSAARLGDWLVADARIARLGKHTAHVHGAIYRGEEILLTMSGVFAIHRSG